jgi:hypothetical protein
MASLAATHRAGLIPGPAAAPSPHPKDIHAAIAAIHHVMNAIPRRRY